VYELALFAGAGGGLLATKWLLGFKTICYVENGEYPVEVLKARIGDGLLDDAPIWDDIRTFDGRPWRGCVDIVTAGFPCQPFSGAGKRLGEQDERNLWPDTARIIRQVRPRYVFLENVPTLRCPIRHGEQVVRSYFGRVLGDLAESGYDARWDCLSASAVGAPHRRDRVWVIAYSNADEGGLKVVEKFNSSSIENSTKRDTRREYVDGLCDNVADTDSGRGQRAQDQVCPGRGVTELCGQNVGHADCTGSSQWKAENVTPNLESVERSGWWQIEPDMGRVVDGLAHRVDRLAAIGEGQVPAVVAVVWRLLIQDWQKMKALNT